jgi:predicted nucleic acid-binding protein
VATKLELAAAIKQYRRLLLDTNLLIAEFKRQVNVLEEIPRPQRFTSLVAVWEFVHVRDGQLIAHAERTGRRDWMDRQGIQSVWLSRESEHVFRNLLWHTSGPRGVADRLLAAESISRKWPLVTRNVKDFDDLDGMMIVPY